MENVYINTLCVYAACTFTLVENCILIKDRQQKFGTFTKSAPVKCTAVVPFVLHIFCSVHVLFVDTQFFPRFPSSHISRCNVVEIPGFYILFGYKLALEMYRIP